MIQGGAGTWRSPACHWLDVTKRQPQKPFGRSAYLTCVGACLPSSRYLLAIDRELAGQVQLASLDLQPLLEAGL